MTLSRPDFLAAMVKAAADTYTDPPTWMGMGLNQSIQAHRSIVDGKTVVAFRGTATWHDWFEDFRAAPHDLAWHPELKTRVETGFLAAALSIIPLMQIDLKRADYLAGHSLGGALALLIAAVLPEEARPERIVCFAPAAPFADAVPDWIIPITDAFRYGNDPVPIEPQWFPQVPLYPIGRADHANPASCHHMANYVAALTPAV